MLPTAESKVAWGGGGGGPGVNTTESTKQERHLAVYSLWSQNHTERFVVCNTTKMLLPTVESKVIGLEGVGGGGGGVCVCGGAGGGGGGGEMG